MLQYFVRMSSVQFGKGCCVVPSYWLCTSRAVRGVQAWAGRGAAGQEWGALEELKDSYFPVCKGGIYLQRDWRAVPGSCVQVEWCYSTIICDVCFDKATPHELYNEINFSVFHTISIVILKLNLVTIGWGRKAKVRYFFQCHTQNFPPSDIEPHV